MNILFTLIHTAAHMIGRFQLQNSAANNNAYAIEHTPIMRAAKESQNIFDNANMIMHVPNPATASSNFYLAADGKERV